MNYTDSHQDALANEPWKVDGFIKGIILFKHNFAIGSITILYSSVTLG